MKLLKGATEIFKSFRALKPWSLTREELVEAIRSNVLSNWSDHNDEVEFAGRLLLQLSLDDPAIESPSAHWSAETNAFYRCILNRYYKRLPFDRKKGWVSFSSEEEDFLVSGVDVWSPMKALNYALLMAQRPVRKSAIVATVRNEGVSLLEWVAYHRLIGFDAICIYTNDNTDGSLELLQCLAEHGIIYLTHNEVSSALSPQRKAYEHALLLQPMLHDFEWAAFIDADEFVVVSEVYKNGIEDLLDDVTCKMPASSAVCLNWKWFGSGGRFERRPGLCVEQYLRAVDNKHVKAICKVRDVVTYDNVHFPSLFDDCYAIDGDLTPVKNPSEIDSAKYKAGQINHYWNKSFEEFVIKKNRGRATMGLAGEQRSYESFFGWDGSHNGKADHRLANFSSDIRKEMDQLLELPGMQAAVHEVERGFYRLLETISSTSDIRKAYKNDAKA